MYAVILLNRFLWLRFIFNLSFLFNFHPVSCICIFVSYASFIEWSFPGVLLTLLPDSTAHVLLIQFMFSFYAFLSFSLLSLFSGLKSLIFSQCDIHCSHVLFVKRKLRTCLFPGRRKGIRSRAALFSIGKRVRGTSRPVVVGAVSVFTVHEYSQPKNL